MVQSILNSQVSHKVVQTIPNRTLKVLQIIPLIICFQIRCQFNKEIPLIKELNPHSIKELPIKDLKVKLFIKVHKPQVTLRVKLKFIKEI